MTKLIADEAETTDGQCLNLCNINTLLALECSRIENSIV